jgi:type II secretory ATPase GspE/PulE/Tfp pilus assembly ATPase PilB-like protein
MFDPTKLDLNLDDSEKKAEEIGKENQNEVTPTPEETPIVAEEKIQENNKEVITQEETQQETEDTKRTPETNSEDENEEAKSPNNEEEENNIIFNINITSLQDVLTLLIEKQYDFVLLEPQTDAIKISFRKDKIEKEAHFIKYPIYSKILLKAKTLTNLAVDETEEVQEGSGELTLKVKTYKLSTKVVPSELGEKLFLKAKELEKKVKKEVKKTSVSQIL